MNKSRKNELEGYFMSKFRELGIRPMPISELKRGLEKEGADGLDRYFSLKLKELGIESTPRSR